MTNHLPSIAAGVAPGALAVRIVTEAGALLDAHALELHTAVSADLSLVAWHLLEHPDGRVFVYVYDGDSGLCLSTVVVDGPGRG